MPNEQLDDVAAEILDAASRRFLHYGYNKTTMSEIAKDCNMSTGNLYRYFKSKLDIAELFVHRLRRSQSARLREVIDAVSGDAREKLRAFFHTKLQLVYDRLHDNPKAYEISMAIMNDRPKIALEWEAAERRIICEILLAGVSEGLFVIDDVMRTAKVLQDAVFRHNSITVYYEGEIDEIAEELSALVEFLIDGLMCRHDH
ncbi:MAG: TetR/AcrR family transcriptional regulator [Pseudomonadota bacterium]